MPTKRTRRARNKRTELSAVTMAFLSDQEPPEDTTEDELVAWRFRPESQKRAVWESVQGEILAAWIAKYPGTRPSSWWEWSAPRASDDQLRAWNYEEGSLMWRERPCEPRLRTGGTGTPCYEVLAHVPEFEYGLPVQWVDRWSVDYYGPDFAGVPADPDDPPRFESEAAYLKRHGLILPGEERRLTDEDFEPEAIEFDEPEAIAS